MRASPLGLYLLAPDDPTTPVPVPDEDGVLAWADWFEAADRTVALTAIGDPPVAYVSTVFLGIGWDGRLWETMAFPAIEDGVDWTGRDFPKMRYRSHAAAVEGHAAAVATLRDQLARLIGRGGRLRST